MRFGTRFSQEPISSTLLPSHNFPRLSERTLEDIIVPDTTDGEAQLKAAFFDGYSDDLSQQEIDEYWNDAKEYLRFKIERRKKRKG